MSVTFKQQNTKASATKRLMK